MTFSRDDYEAKITTMTREAQASAERAVATAQRYADDLAAAHGVTARLRETLAAGGTDEVQAMALGDATQFLLGAYLTKGQWIGVCAALLASHEEHKATAARLASVLAGVERVIAEARGT